MYVFAHALWLLLPYPINPTQEEINTVWSTHVLAEKLFGHLITIALSTFGVYQFKPELGLKAIFLSIFSCVSYHIIGAAIWIARFGYEPYLGHSLPMQLLGLAIVLSGFAALVAYKWLPNKRVEQNC